jgi:hypothetical protein
MRSDICNFVRGCQECQRTKPDQNSRVGLHSSEVVAMPLELVFINILGPFSEVGGGIRHIGNIVQLFKICFYVSGHKDFLRGGEKLPCEKKIPTYFFGQCGRV